MPNPIVSGRVDENVKRIADEYIKRQGLTTAEIIAGVWNRIADTGELPIQKPCEVDNSKQKALQRLEALRASTPTGTPLAFMTDADVKEELANRA